jgi:putative membrane protein
MTGIASAVAIFGFITQGLNRFSNEGDVFETGARWVYALEWWIDVVGLVLIVSLLAVGAYVLSFWGFRLTRNRAGSLHTRRGLLTSREVSIDHSRLRGVSLGEPLGLRWAGGRRLKAVSTGLQGERGGGSDWLAPPAPVARVTALAAEVVADDAAVGGDLAEHGPAARRRRMTRALWLPLSVLVLLSAASEFLSWPTWLLLLVVPVAGVAAWLARDRYRGLGHRVTARHLVSRNGSLDRTRVVLDRDGIVGWKVERSYFQRRAGVATLVATSGAGEQHYDLVDLTPERAYELIAEISPELLKQFS